MVDRTKMTDKECIESLVNCIKIVKDAKEKLRLYEGVLLESQAEFVRRFGTS